MNITLRTFWVLGIAFGGLFAAVRAAPFAYIPNNTDGTVSVIDVASNIVTATIQLPPQNYPRAVAVNPRGTRVFVSGSSGVFGISTFSNTLSTTPLLPGIYATALALNATGSKLYATTATGSAGQVCTLDTLTGSSPGCINVGAAPRGVAVAPDGARLYVTNMNASSLSVVDLVANSVIATVTVGADPWGVAVNRAGTRVFVVSLGARTVSVIDTSNNALLATIGVGINPVGVAITPDDSRLFVSNAGEGTVSVIDTQSNTLVDTVTVGSAPVGVTVAPRGDFVYVANSGSNNVSVVRTSDNAVVGTVAVGQAPYAEGRFIGGGRLLDIDGDGEVTSTTDLLLLMRWRLGLRGAALIAGAIVPVGATRTTPEQIESYLGQLDALGAP